MPSIIIHEWASRIMEEKIKNSNKKVKMDENSFILGGIKIDMLNVAKEISHYKELENDAIFMVMDLDRAAEILGYHYEGPKEKDVKVKVNKALGTMRRYLKDRNFKLTKEECLKLGMYAHLILDADFFERYMTSRIKGDFERRKVIDTLRNREWTPEEFFLRPDPSIGRYEDGVLYSSYTRLNHEILDKGYVKKEDIEKLPDKIPNRRGELKEKTWKQEIQEYLTSPCPEYGIFTPEEISEYLDSFADRIIQVFEQES